MVCNSLRGRRGADEVARQIEVLDVSADFKDACQAIKTLRRQHVVGDRQLSQGREAHQDWYKRRVQLLIAKLVLTEAHGAHALFEETLQYLHGVRE